MDTQLLSTQCPPFKTPQKLSFPILSSAKKSRFWTCSSKISLEPASRVSDMFFQMRPVHFPDTPPRKLQQLTPSKPLLPDEKIQLQFIKNISLVLSDSGIIWTERMKSLNALSDWITSPSISKILASSLSKDGNTNIQHISLWLEKFIYSYLHIDVLGLRAQLCRASCNLIATLTASLGPNAKPLIELALPLLLKNVTKTKKTFVDIADQIIINMIDHSSDFSPFVTSLVLGCFNQHPNLRERCLGYLLYGLNKYTLQELESIDFMLDKILDTLKKLISDSKEPVRLNAIRCLDRIKEVWPESHTALVNSLDSATLKQLQFVSAKCFKNSSTSNATIANCIESTSLTDSSKGATILEADNDYNSSYASNDESIIADSTKSKETSLLLNKMNKLLSSNIASIPESPEIEGNSDLISKSETQLKRSFHGLLPKPFQMSSLPIQEQLDSSPFPEVPSFDMTESEAVSCVTVTHEDQFDCDVSHSLDERILLENTELYYSHNSKPLVPNSSSPTSLSFLPSTPVFNGEISHQFQALDSNPKLVRLASGHDTASLIDRKDAEISPKQTFDFLSEFKEAYIPSVPLQVSPSEQLIVFNSPLPTNQHYINRSFGFKFSSIDKFPNMCQSTPIPKSLTHGDETPRSNSSHHLISPIHRESTLDICNPVSNGMLSLFSSKQNTDNYFTLFALDSEEYQRHLSPDGSNNSCLSSNIISCDLSKPSLSASITHDFHQLFDTGLQNIHIQDQIVSKIYPAESHVMDLLYDNNDGSPNSSTVYKLATSNSTSLNLNDSLKCSNLSDHQKLDETPSPGLSTRNSISRLSSEVSLLSPFSRADITKHSESLHASYKSDTANRFASSHATALSKTLSLYSLYLPSSRSRVPIHESALNCSISQCENNSFDMDDSMSISLSNTSGDFCKPLDNNQSGFLQDFTPIDYRRKLQTPNSLFNSSDKASSLSSRLIHNFASPSTQNVPRSIEHFDQARILNNDNCPMVDVVSHPEIFPSPLESDSNLQMNPGYKHIPISAHPELCASLGATSNHQSHGETSLEEHQAAASSSIRSLFTYEVLLTDNVGQPLSFLPNEQILNGNDNIQQPHSDFLELDNELSGESVEFPVQRIHSDQQDDIKSIPSPEYKGAYVLSQDMSTAKNDVFSSFDAFHSYEEDHNNLNDVEEDDINTEVEGEDMIQNMPMHSPELDTDLQLSNSESISHYEHDYHAPLFKTEIHATNNHNSSQNKLLSPIFKNLNLSSPEYRLFRSPSTLGKIQFKPTTEEDTSIVKNVNGLEIESDQSAIVLGSADDSFQNSVVDLVEGMNIAYDKPDTNNRYLSLINFEGLKLNYGEKNQSLMNQSQLDADEKLLQHLMHNQVQLGSRYEPFGVIDNEKLVARVELAQFSMDEQSNLEAECKDEHLGIIREKFISEDGLGQSIMDEESKSETEVQQLDIFKDERLVSEDELNPYEIAKLREMEIVSNDLCEVGNKQLIAEDDMEQSLIDDQSQLGAESEELNTTENKQLIADDDMEQFLIDELSHLKTESEELNTTKAKSLVTDDDLKYSIVDEKLLLDTQSERLDILERKGLVAENELRDSVIDQEVQLECNKSTNSRTFGEIETRTDVSKILIQETNDKSPASLPVINICVKRRLGNSTRGRHAVNSRASRLTKTQLSEKDQDTTLPCIKASSFHAFPEAHNNIQRGPVQQENACCIPTNSNNVQDSISITQASYLSPKIRENRSPIVSSRRCQNPSKISLVPSIPINNQIGRCNDSLPILLSSPTVKLASCHEGPTSKISRLRSRNITSQSTKHPGIPVPLFSPLSTRAMAAKRHRLNLSVTQSPVTKMNVSSIEKVKRRQPTRSVVGMLKQSGALLNIRPPQSESSKSQITDPYHTLSSLQSPNATKTLDSTQIPKSQVSALPPTFITEHFGKENQEQINDTSYLVKPVRKRPGNSKLPSKSTETKVTTSGIAGGAKSTQTRSKNSNSLPVIAFSMQSAVVASTPIAKRVHLRRAAVVAKTKFLN